MSKIRNAAMGDFSCQTAVHELIRSSLDLHSQMQNGLTHLGVKGDRMIHLNSAFPVFVVKSLDKAKIFYADHFGFNVVFQNEWYLHLASQSGIQIGFILPNQPTQPDIFHKSHCGDGVIFSLEVNDADSAYAYVKNSSLDIVLELRSEEWGQRHFSLRDPNGVYIDIVQAIEPSEAYQAGYDEK